jgi:hypothetical protein
MTNLNRKGIPFLCAALCAVGLLFGQTAVPVSAPIASLDLFPDYATRAAYQTATGQQAPPYNVALPVKGWTDPNCAANTIYTVFDATAAATGYVVQLSVPLADCGVNLPGAYTYPAFVPPAPTDATLVGPFGSVGNVSADSVCLKADAQALANTLAPLYAGSTLTVVDNSMAGIYHTVYGQDPRRQWGISISATSLPGVMYAQPVIESAARFGVGAPGHWSLAPLSPGLPAALNWVQDPQVINAPAGAVPVPVPIRALLSSSTGGPNEVFDLVPPHSPFASWMVVRTDLTPTVIGTPPCVSATPVVAPTVGTVLHQ